MLTDKQIAYWARLYNGIKADGGCLYTLGQVCRRITGASMADGKRIVDKAAQLRKENYQPEKRAWRN